MAAPSERHEGIGVAPVWPELTLSAWEETRDTLHLWTQVVGKVRLALEPMVNHWWQVPLYVSARGLTTSLMHSRGHGLEMEFDFVDHVLVIRKSSGEVRHVLLEPRSVASFYAETIAALDALGLGGASFSCRTQRCARLRIPTRYSSASSGPRTMQPPSWAGGTEPRLRPDENDDGRTWRQLGTAVGVMPSCD